MPKQKQETWSESYRTSDTSQTRTVDVAPMSSVEQMLQDLAMTVYRNVVNQVGDMNSMSWESLLTPQVSPQMQGLVAGAQNATMRAARTGMEGAYEDMGAQYRNALGASGGIDSTALGGNMDLARRDMLRNLAQMAQQSQAQGQQQLIGLAQQNQGVGLNLLQMRNQMAQWAADPQMLRDQTNYRLQTAAITQTGHERTVGNEHSVGITKTPTDWAGLAKSLGMVAAVAAAPFTGGTSLLAMAPLSAMGGGNPGAAPAIGSPQTQQAWGNAMANQPVTPMTNLPQQPYYQNPYAFVPYGVSPYPGVV